VIFCMMGITRGLQPLMVEPEGSGGLKHPPWCRSELWRSTSRIRVSLSRVCRWVGEVSGGFGGGLAKQWAFRENDRKKESVPIHS
jgi:hypothetical protein